MIDTQAIRSKILDLAMRGKLTEQLPEDGTGKELLAKISTSKNGKLRGNKKGMPISFTPPFHLPRGWAWGQLETLGADVSCAFADGPFGSNLKKEHYTTERQVRIIQLSNVGVDGWRNNNEKYTTYDHLETIKRSEVKAGNIVIAKMMPAGRAIVVPEGIADAFVLSSDCVKFVPDPKLDVNFICYAINSNWFHDQVMKDVHGIGRERTSLSNLKRYFIPIPSEPEQHRIVARIEQAFSALDTIDTLQAKYADNLAVLKSKLIDDAIQGKLTEQLPEDGTAEELYRQIQAEKQALIKAGKIKKEKPLPEIAADEVPFGIPSNWKWVRVGSVAEVAGGTTPKSSEICAKGTIPYFKVSDMNAAGNETHMIHASNFISKGYTGRVFPVGTTIFPKNGGAALTNKRRVLVVPSAVDLNTGGCTPVLFEMTEWIRLFMDTIDFGKMDTGSNIPTVNATNLKNQYLPLPPLAEQKRIVAKLEELLPLCDEMRKV